MDRLTYNVEVANHTKGRGIVQVLGVCVTCAAFGYICAGRANSAWFIAFTLYERVVACVLFTYIYMTGTISLQQLVSEVCIDAGTALYTWYLLQLDRTEAAQKQAQD